MRRLGLRARVTAAFALGALVLSVVLATLTYELVRTEAMRSEQSADDRQAFVSANLIRSGLRTADPDVPLLLSGLAVPSGSIPVLYGSSEWYSTSLAAGRDSLPASLRETVLGGKAATQRFTLDGQPAYAVGVPLVDDKGAYFELFSLSDLAHTLDILFLSLAAAAALTTMGGVAVGRWASHRLLAPLRETARVAAAIAGGQLDTRLAAGDIDLADLTSSFNAMVEALQGRIRRDARFASDVSHELRSPLTTIQTAMQVMEHRRDELPERSAQALDLLSAEVGRFERLVQDLLEISSTSDGGNRLALEEVDPRELLQHSVAVTGADAVPMDIDESLDGWVVWADKRRMERVVANLIENAQIHAEGVTRIGLSKVGRSVRLVVEDAGPGVPLEERAVIFDRFTRGSAGRRRAAGRGTGLGLSLVDEHVRMHGGRVWVEDRPGGGARFVVELPLLRYATSEEPA